MAGVATVASFPTFESNATDTYLPIRALVVVLPSEP
jgi:hypothetical protein